MSKSICVYCSSSNAVSTEFFNAAAELGELIASENYTLVYGGGATGLMGEVARSVHRNGGHIVGVIPKFLRKPGIAYEESDELIVTSDMRERKAEMENRADAFIGMPGGFGTLEEMLEIITLKQLRTHIKPVVFLNTSGFFNGLNEVFEHVFEHHFAKPAYKQLYYFAPTPKSVMDYISAYKPPVLDSKWY